MATIIKRNILPHQIEADIAQSFSLIDSGCIPFENNEKIVFVIKDTNAKISSLNNLNKVRFKIRPIVRPEFPTICTEIVMRNNKNVSFKYDYFFNTESHEEIDLITKLLNQKEMELFFYNIEIKKGILLLLEQNELLQIKKALDEIKC